jgi:hypothetical protein
MRPGVLVNLGGACRLAEGSPAMLSMMDQA